MSTRGATAVPRRERLAWCSYDFANSAFATIAITAFGAPYFKNVLAHGGLRIGPFVLDGTATWGLAIAVSMAIVTVTSPVMGAIADRSGRKKPFLIAYTLVGVVATAALGLVPSGSASAAFATYVVANVAFEGAYVFYNAFLPELAPPERLGRLSGVGWAIGYAGGLLALIAARPLMPPAYDVAHAGRASSVYFVVAAWFLVFSLPALIWLRDRAPRRGAPEGGYVRGAFRELASTIRGVRAYRPIAIFLVAYFLYTDALTTVIDFTGIYTDEVLGFTPSDNVTLFLVLNVIAAPGALLFGVLVDRIGGRRAISWSLLVWVLVVAGAMLARTKAHFWPVAVLAAVVIGATQASSRALMARLAPRERIGEFMGLLALSGKASAIVGPLLYGAVAGAFADAADAGRGHRIAIGAIGTFFVLAWIVLRGVRDPVRDVDDAPPPPEPAR